MAGVKKPREILRENAKALELYMRTSPEAASFLDCFTVDVQHPGILDLHYYGMADEHQEQVHRCIAHFERLFSHVQERLGTPVHQYIPAADEIEFTHPNGRIVQQKLDPEGRLSLHVAIDDSRFRDVALEAAAQVINERRMQPGYTLAYFPRRGQQPEGYDGLLDSREAQARLKRPFTQDVTPKDLKKLLYSCTHLAALAVKSAAPER